MPNHAPCPPLVTSWMVARTLVGMHPYCLGDLGTVLRPATLGESLPLDDRSPPVGYGPNRQSPTLVINHRPYPSVADWRTRASNPIPTFLGLAPVLSSNINHYFPI